MMLKYKVSPNIKLLSQSQSIFCRARLKKFSSVHRGYTPDLLGTTALPLEAIQAYKFQNSFDATGYSDFYSIQEGGYVNLDRRELDKYFPEGFAGELDSEFEFTGRKSWMVRDSSKFLCRLIDKFEASKKGEECDEAGTGYRTQVTVPGLTDRSEWRDSNLRVFYNGIELAKNTDVKPNKKKLVAVSGKGSTVGELLTELETMTDEVPKKIMLAGPRGVGKSIVLNQAVLHARKRGWLCLFVPRGWDQIHSGDFIEPNPFTEDGSVFDNPMMTVELLRGFWKAHHEMLKDLPIQNIDNTKKYENIIEEFRVSWKLTASMPGRGKFNFVKMRSFIEDEDNFPDEDQKDAEILQDYDFMNMKLQSLEDLILLGIALRDLAGPVFVDLVTELRQVESVPVLIAVDQYNTWDVNSSFYYKSVPVHGRSLSVPKSLSFISKVKAQSLDWEMKNGICLAATSLRHTEGLKETYENVKASVPLVIKVPSYSQVEFLAAVSYYTHQQIVDPSVTTQELLAYRMHSGSIPRIARIEAVPFFFPLCVAKQSSSFMDARDDFPDEVFGGSDSYDDGDYDDDTPSKSSSSMYAKEDI